MKPPTRTTHGRPAEVSKTPAAIQTAPVLTPGISRGREDGKGAAAASGKSAARVRRTGDEASSTPPPPKPAVPLGDYVFFAGDTSDAAEPPRPLPSFPMSRPWNVVVTGLGDPPDYCPPRSPLGCGEPILRHSNGSIAAYCNQPPGHFEKDHVWNVNRDPLVPAPACANPRKDGPCFACAYCKATAAGPEWWLLDPAALTTALLTTSVAHENKKRRLADPFTMRAYPIPSLPQSPVSRLQMACDLLGGVPIRDAEGRDTGERTAPLISKATFKRLVDGTEAAPRRRRKR